jgi:MYXO-CTERM domain-containing protein
VTLEPGSHGRVTVMQDGQLALRSGTYYLDGVRVRSGGSLVINQEEGPVVLYVREALGYWGSTAVVQDEHPNLLVGYFGTRAAVLGAPFRGAFIAPNAKVFLGPDGDGLCGWFGESHDWWGHDDDCRHDYRWRHADGDVQGGYDWWSDDGDDSRYDHHWGHGDDDSEGAHRCQDDDDDDDSRYGHDWWHGDDDNDHGRWCQHQGADAGPYEGVFFAKRISVLPHVEVIYHPFALPETAVTPDETVPGAGGAGPDAQAGAGGHDGASDNGGSRRRGAICALQSRSVGGNATWPLLVLGVAALRRTRRRHR